MENENENNNRTFQYTYSAKQQEEVKQIRRKYLPSEEDKLERLKRLDQSATQKGTTVSLIFGILGALLFGFGMCCVLIWAEEFFIPGIVIGIIGAVVLSLAHPLYSYITKKERERIAPEIMRLTDELLK